METNGQWGHPIRISFGNDKRHSPAGSSFPPCVLYSRLPHGGRRPYPKAVGFGLDCYRYPLILTGRVKLWSYFCVRTKNTTAACITQAASEVEVVRFGYQFRRAASCASRAWLTGPPVGSVPKLDPATPPLTPPQTTWLVAFSRSASNCRLTFSHTGKLRFKPRSTL